MNPFHLHQQLIGDAAYALSEDELSLITGGFTYPQASQFQNLLQQAEIAASGVRKTVENAWQWTKENVVVPVVLHKLPVIVS